MRARPTIAYRSQLEPEPIAEAFRVALAAEDSACAGSVGRSEVTLFIDDRRRRRWSPFLQLKLTGEGTTTRIHGVMGPQPNLWTAFVFVYSAHVAAFIGGSVLGCVQLTLGQDPIGVWVAAAALLGLGGACGLDLFGRRLGEGQMGILRGMVEQTLPNATAEGSQG